MAKIRIAHFILAASLIASYVFANDYTSSYNRLNIILITDFFRALTQKKYNLALGKLERLKEVYPESPLFHNLSGDINESIIIAEAKKYLDTGDYDQAMAVLDRPARDSPSGQRLKTEREKLQGLIRVRDYVKHMPFSEADVAEEAFSQLPKPAFFGEDIHHFYSEWHKEQQSHLETLIFHEKKVLIDELLYEIDISLCTASGVGLIVLNQLLDLNNSKESQRPPWDNILHAFFPRTLDSQVVQKLVDDQIFLPEEQSALFAGNRNRLRELALCSAYRHGTETIRSKLIPVLQDKTASTLIGLLIKAEINFKRNEFFTGLKNFTNVYNLLGRLNGQDFSSEIGRNYLSNDVIPIPPSVYNVLFHLYYTQQFP